MKLEIQGLREAQQANQRMIAALKPAGAFGQALKGATVRAQRHAISITHVDSGALRASHRMRLTSLRGEVFLDPTARNPFTGQKTAFYGGIEHAKGGEHAFYERTVKEQGDRIAGEATQTLLKQF
jgi:hypothetical protein